VNNLNAEIFWPPYFGRGPRPVIWSAPTAVAYGQLFNVITPDVANVAHVRLLSYGSNTHTFDMTQRLKGLAFFGVPTESRLQVSMESNRNLLPPGYYMLFLLNNLEVPSFGWSIRVG
jgi:galactose oxidase